MSDRLQALQGELQTILDEKMGALRTAIESAESATKGIVSAELEIARNEQTAETLAEDSQRLSVELTKAKERAEQAKSANEALRKERDELALILQGVDEEGGDLRSEVGDLQNKVRDSETSNARLQAEQDSLHGKLKNLEETATKMRALKAELMSSIQQNMDELSGGN